MIDSKIALLINQAEQKDLDSIRIFKERADKLYCNSIVRREYMPIADLHINHQGVSHRFQLPSEEAFDSLLMTFRHFWLQDEPCNFFKILKIIDRYVPDARNHTKSLKSLWKQGLFHSTHIIIDDVQLTSEKLIDIWLNAEFFHNDKTKRFELESIINRIDFDSPGFTRFLLIVSIIECCNVIFELNKLLGKV
ncbi:hypothetical protein [Methylomonas albis]|uniref:Uncharacterized protein n=1 Tax=Methylomonas albis TaxID=1854563 RepID=A0ABR9CY28_9GAMM|nr:hypothetical protein [Methylomonas albis]MBD9355635.1 hypothetical protein [Methylomonas albis]